jgi:hypothetical protein
LFSSSVSNKDFDSIHLHHLAGIKVFIALILFFSQTRLDDGFFECCQSLFHARAGPPAVGAALLQSFSNFT